MANCFACDRKLGKNPKMADTRDGQTVFVGTECFKLIEQAGDEGYQPPTGGPRLWLPRFYVKTRPGSPVGRKDRTPHTVIDRTTNEVVDEYTSARAAQMHADFASTEAALAPRT